MDFGNYNIPLDIFKNIAYRVDNISKINQLNRQIHSVVDQSDDIWLKFIENKWCPFDLAKEYSGKQEVKDVLRYYFTDLRRLNDVERVYRLDQRVTTLLVKTTAFEHVPAANMDNYVGRLATQIKNGLNPSLKEVALLEEYLNSKERKRQKFRERHMAALLIALASSAPNLETLYMLRGSSYDSKADYHAIWAALASLLESRPPKLQELGLKCCAFSSDATLKDLTIRSLRACAGLSALRTFCLDTWDVEGTVLMLDHCNFSHLTKLQVRTLAGKGKGVLAPEYSEKFKAFIGRNRYLTTLYLKGWKIEEIGKNVLRDIVLERLSMIGFVMDKKWTKRSIVDIVNAYLQREQQDFDNGVFPRRFESIFRFQQGAKSKTFEGLKLQAEKENRCFLAEGQPSNGVQLLIQKINEFGGVEDFFFYTAPPH